MKKFQAEIGAIKQNVSGVERKANRVEKMVKELDDEVDHVGKDCEDLREYGRNFR